jgi:hypothetical protein
MNKTPEEQANELINKYLDLQIHGTSSINATNRASNCAAICVETILAECKFLGTADYRIPYWQSVLTAINKNSI